MANKYAVASGLWSDTATWSDTDGGAGGASVPADDDAVFILINVSVQMNADLSAYTGLRTVTIRGHATTPAMLYWKDGASGYLKIRSTYNLVGTTGAAKGRLLANSNGTWGGTTAMANTDKATIDLQGTAKIDAQYLDIALYGTNPTNASIRTYKQKFDFDGATAVDPGADTIDLGTTPPSAGTAVMVTTTGTLPVPLQEEYIYYVRSVSGNTCKLATRNADAQIVDITADGSGTISLITGHTDTATATMNVLEDVTSDAPWTTTDGWDRVVLASWNQSAYDQQRLQLTTINAGSVVLSANVDSTQSPGARIWLASRNVQILSAGTSSTQPIVDYANATSAAGVFRCAIINTGGTGTTFYGYGINSGTGHTVSGSVSGCSFGISAGTGHTVSGSVSGCSTGISTGTGHTVSGSVSGCSTGISTGTGHTVSGSVSGCGTGIFTGQMLVVTGRIGYTSSETLAANTTDFTMPIDCVCRGALLPTTPVFSGRNLVTTIHGWGGVYSEDHGRTLGASKAWLPFGTVTKQASVVRGGGASSALQVDPQTNCGASPADKTGILIFEWTELAVAASEQTRSVYIRGFGWSSWPTAAQLYFEAEYVSNGTTFARTTVASTAVLTDNTTWVQFPVTFTPAAAAHVRYRAWLKTYAASSGVYVDAQLV